jgi:hypothetical protein
MRSHHLCFLDADGLVPLTQSMDYAALPVLACASSLYLYQWVRRYAQLCMRGQGGSAVYLLACMLVLFQFTFKSRQPAAHLGPFDEHMLSADPLDPNNNSVNKNSSSLLAQRSLKANRKQRG